MPSSSSSAGGSFRTTHHCRISDFIVDDSDSGSGSGSGEEPIFPSASRFERGMLPVFLDDQSDLVEVMIELDQQTMQVRSVTPTPSAAAVSRRRDSFDSLSQSSSTASKIRQKFAWLMSPSRPPPKQKSLAAIMGGDGASSSSGLAPRDARRKMTKLKKEQPESQWALKGLRFISRTTADPTELWRRVQDRFYALAKDGLLSREDFGECIGMGDSKEFAMGLFDALARRRHQNLERITKDELYDFWLQITDKSFDARLQIFFDMVDTNEDGKITGNEVRELIILSASANKLAKLKEQAEEYAALIMEELDPENLGYIELWQLEELLLQRDRYMNYSRPMSTVGSTTGASLIRGIGCVRRRFCFRRMAALMRVAAMEKWRRAWVLGLWLAAMAGLFCWKITEYRRRSAFQVMGYCLPTAKGAAETLKLNMALVLLPVCRNTITKLRSTRARLFVPFDDNIAFHKVIATAIVIGIILHAGSHLGCDFPRMIGASPEKYSIVAGDFGDDKPTYRSLLLGVEGATGMAMVVLMVFSFTLANRRLRKNSVRLPPPMDRLTGFNAFWYSHHLLAVVYVLFLVHGYFMFLVHRWYQRTTWMYIAFPLLLYVGERILRAFRSKGYAVKILKILLLPGNVLTLTMSKPQGFRYRSGQYIFLQCPTVSPFEWHPFSITSAPGDDYLTVHIRSSGDWTRELKRVFVDNCCISPCSSGRASFSQSGPIEQKSLPRLFVDGPYGAPAQDFRNYDVLLLVGLGIGATPFISILRDLLNNIKLEDELMYITIETSEQSTTSLSSSTTSTSKKRPSPYRTSSAYFYWVTRETGSFEWFKGVMNEVAEMDRKGIIEMHNYLTSVYEERDARSTLLTMVQALNHAKHGVDIVSGMPVKTHFARPNWRNIFYRLSSKHPGSTVGVFYCGTPILAKELRELSLEMSQKTSTRFQFHKEYF